MRHVTRTAIAMFVAVYARNAAAECTTYQNDLDACRILDVSICNNPTVWTAEDADEVNQWEYDDDPEEVCREYWQKWDQPHYDQFGKQVFVTTTSNPDNFNCYLDVNGDGMTTSAYVTQIHSATVPVANIDYCCTLIPHGPYESFARGRGTQGANFAPTMKTAVKAENNTRNKAAIASNFPPNNNKMLYRSDSGIVNAPPTKAVNVDTYDFLGAPPSFTWSAEVDHIIPKKDSHGCPCGYNGYANAQVISKSLNSSTQNRCFDPRRIKILKAYTNFDSVYPTGLPGLPGTGP